MQVGVINKRNKIFNKTINSSILLFTVLWFIIFIFLLFGNSVLTEISSYFMAISLLPLILGFISSIAYIFINKPFIKIDDYREIILILNISEEDYKMGKLRLINEYGNYLRNPISNSLYEISSEQVKELLSIDVAIPIKLEFKVQNSYGLGDMSPKAFLKDSLRLLWGNS